VRRYVSRTADALLSWSQLEPWRRTGLTLFLLDGLAVILVMSFASTYVPLYALAMGATAFEVGLLSSAHSLGVIGGSALSGRLVTALGNPKRVTLYFGRVWHALSYLLLLAIPLFFTDAAAVRVLIVVYALRTLIGETGVPAWAAFVPTLVPIQIRGRFMSLRSVFKMVALMTIMPLAGAVITGLGGYPFGYQVCFAAMAVLGLAATGFFRRIPDPTPAPEPAVIHEAPVRRGAWWRGPFGGFVCGLTVWTLGTALAAPFYVVFMTRDLGLDARAIGLLTALNTAAQLVGFLLLGPQVDRRGNRGALVVSVALLSLLPLGWLLVRHWTHILPLYVLSGLASAGMNLSSLNLLLELSPEDARAGYAGAYYSLLAAATTIAPLIGSWLFAQGGFGGVVIAGGSGGLVGAGVLAALLIAVPRRTPVGRMIP
jgi:MFS family permease